MPIQRAVSEAGRWDRMLLHRNTVAKPGSETRFSQGASRRKLGVGATPSRTSLPLGSGRTNLLFTIFDKRTDSIAVSSAPGALIPREAGILVFL